MYYNMYYIKDMILTLRLKAEQERLMRRASKKLNRSRSQFVREAIARYAEAALSQPGLTAAERLRPWIAAHDSGGLNLSEGTGRKFQALVQGFREKRGSR